MRVLPLQEVRHCSKLSLYEISRETNESKNLVLGPIFVHLAQIWATIFFKNLASSVTRYHGQLSSCTISKKTEDPILTKLSDRRTDRQTDGQTDTSDFIGGCLTDVENQVITAHLWVRNGSKIVHFPKTGFFRKGNTTFLLPTYSPPSLCKYQENC